MKLPEIPSWIFIQCMVVGLALQQHHMQANPEPVQPDQPQHAWVQLALLVVTVALSLLASYLLAKKNKATLKDDKPTTLVTRGSFINWILGVRRVGPLFCWAGSRRFSEESSGKKGGSSPKQKIWHEGGWHVLGIGPAFCLHRILDNGQAIFNGPITRDSHPSGTFIDTGSEGGFFIYWGEPTQPTNAYLADPSRVGILSRWPYHFYVLWADKRLGAAAHWPLLDYEVEVRVENSNLTQTDPHFQASQGDPGVAHTVFEVDTSGSTDFFVFQGAHTTDFQSKMVATLAGNAANNGPIEVLFVEVFQFQTGTHPIFMTPIFETRTRLHFASGTLTGSDDQGTVTPTTLQKNFGVNAAHAIDRMLHETWPQGLGLPTTGIFAGFSLPSLEELGVLVGPAGEALRTSWVAKDGDTVATVLGTGLQDLGVMIPLDPDTGLIIFKALRDPTGTTIARIRDDLIVDELPETEVLHAERPADRMTFSFPDRNLVDRDGTIAIMDDGQILQGFELQHARNVQITITTDFDTASKIAQRRSAEELSGGAAVTLKTNRRTRRLLPGDPVVVDALPELMRVNSIKLSTESNVVVLELMVDFYAIPLTPFKDEAPPQTGDILPVEADLQKAIVEIPEYFLGTDVATVIVPRIRAHAQTFQATVHISRDNVTYVQQGVEFDVQAGGTITAGLPAPNTGGSGSDSGGLILEEQGPEFEALGPDIGIVVDLSSDLTNWRIGRQIAVINSLAGVEICFLRNITAIGGSTWRLDGLLRARFDTVALDHPAGAEVYIFDLDAILPVQDPLIAIGEDLFAKTQPAANGILPLDADNPVAVNLYGKSISLRPVPVGALAVTAPDLVSAYQTGDDVDVRWDFGTPQQQAGGAGLQGAGTAIVGLITPDEDFQLEIRNAAGTVVVRTETQFLNTFTYTNVDINADHGGEPTFQVWVYQRRGGLLADPVKLIVEKI